MTVLKALLAGLIVMPLVLSTASAIDDNRTIKRTEAISKRSVLPIKPMSNLQNQEQKRVFNSIVISQSQAAMPEALEKIPYGIHNVAVSKDCYMRFGSPPVFHVLGHTYNIDCSTWTYLSAE